jgi:hypothetical protein
VVEHLLCKPEAFSSNPSLTKKKKKKKEKHFKRALTSTFVEMDRSVECDTFPLGGAASQKLFPPCTPIITKAGKPSALWKPREKSMCRPKVGNLLLILPKNSAAGKQVSERPRRRRARGRGHGPARPPQCTSLRLGTPVTSRPVPHSFSC